MKELGPRDNPITRFLENWYRTNTRFVDRTVTVGTTVTEILPANPNRLAAQMMNRSVNDGAVSTDGAMTFANGVLTGANGGYVQLDVKDDGEAVGLQWLAIQNAASGIWRVWEVIAL